jgi:hypothetical protein
MGQFLGEALPPFERLGWGKAPVTAAPKYVITNKNPVLGRGECFRRNHAV